MFAGCTTAKLRTSTVSQAGSLTELQYQHILNNLAMFCSNPEIIPLLVNLRDGLAQIADLGSTSYVGDWYRAFTSHPNIFGSRTVVEQWSMSPVTDDNELELLRLAYRRAVGFDERLQKHMDLANDFAHELVKQLPEVDDYRGSIVSQYEDFKNQFRNGNYRYDENGKVIGMNPDLSPKSFYDTKGILKYIFVASDLNQESITQQFLNSTISSVDSRLIYDNEIITYINIYRF